MKHLIIICLIFFLSSGNSIIAQKSKEYTKLKFEIDSINEIPYDYIASNPELCEQLFLKNRKQAEKIQYEYGEAISMSWLSMIYYFTGKNDLSTYYSLEAVRIFENSNLLPELANEYGELGYRLKRRNIQKAFYYMRKGLEIAEAIKDSVKLCNLYDNYGVLHELNKNNDSAFFFYKRSLDICEKLNDSVGIGYSLFNIANLLVINKQFSKAEKYWKRGLDIRKKLKNRFGLAESYIVIAEFHSAEGTYDLSIDYFYKALLIFREIDQLYYQILCIDKLSKLYEQKNELKTALEYRKLFAVLKDSLFNIESNTQINELEIQYQTEKKDKELALQKVEINEKELKVKRRTFLLITSSVIVLFLIILSVIVYNKQKFKQKQLIRESILKEKLAEEEIKNELHSERMRISRDLHDNLGSHLSFIISSVENILFFPDLSREKMREKVHDVKEFSVNTIALFRDTVWALSKDDMSLEEFKVKLLKFIEKANKTYEEISINIHHRTYDPFELNAVQSLNLFRIIQEAVNNSLKYSGTERIDINIEQDENRSLMISVKDFGPGFDLKEESEGNGIKNMKSRISEIGGTIFFDTRNGTHITIKSGIFPLNKEKD